MRSAIVTRPWTAAGWLALPILAGLSAQLYGQVLVEEGAFDQSIITSTPPSGSGARPQQIFSTPAVQFPFSTDNFAGQLRLEFPPRLPAGELQADGRTIIMRSAERVLINLEGRRTKDILDREIRVEIDFGSNPGCGVLTQNFDTKKDTPINVTLSCRLDRITLQVGLGSPPVFLPPRLPSSWEIRVQSGHGWDYSGRVHYLFPVRNTVTLAEVLPDPSSGFPEGKVTFSGRATYAAARAASLALRLFDREKDGTLQGSSDFVNIAAGGGSQRLEIKDFEARDGIPDLYLKAVMIDRVTSQVLVESPSIRYQRPPDVSIDRIELVQVVQDEPQTAPLIARKPTILRVLVKQKGALDDPIAAITATIRAFRGNREIRGTPAIPGDSPKSIRAWEKPDRLQMEHSLNYVLPDEWVPQSPEEASEPYRYEAELQLPGNRPEGPKANNKETITRWYKDSTQLAIATVKVCVDDVCPKDKSVAQLSYLQRVSPSGTLFIPMGTLRFPDDVLSYGFLSSYLQGDLFDAEIRLALLAHLDRLRVEHRNFDLIVGILPQISGRTVGRAVLHVPQGGALSNTGPLGAIFIQESRVFEHTLAHYIGRQMGLLPSFADCPSPFVTGDPGFDVRKGEFKGSGRPNLMNARCIDTWLSAGEYGALERGLRTVFENKIQSTPAAAGKAGSRAAGPAPAYLLVSGIASKDGSQSILLPAFSTAASRPSPDLPSGGHCLQFFADRPLTRHCFDLSFNDADGEPVSRAFFTRVIPFPEGATRLALLRGDTELASISGAAPPVVQFADPPPGSRLQGTHTLRWSGTDSGGSELTYMVLYSNDDTRTWRPLLASGRVPEFTVDAGRLAGRRIHFQVRASNGLRSAEATAGPFEVVQSPRLAAIPPPESFGNLQAGLMREIEIPLENTGSGSLRVTAIASDNPEFEPGPQLDELAPGQAESLVVAFKPKTAGAKMAVVTIETDDPANPQYTISVNGTAFAAPVANITTAPAQLDFGAVNTGQTKDLEIVVGNSGNAALNVSSLAFSSPVFSVTTPGQFTVAPGAGSRVTIRFRPVAAGVVNALVTINSDDPSRGAVRIALVGSGAGGGTMGSPRIDVSPGALAFGDVTVGQIREFEAVVRNTGSAALGVSRIASSNPRFTLAAPAVPFAVATGGQQTIRIRYAPAAVGSENADLTISSNDPTRPAVTLSLSGRGVTAPASAPAIDVVPLTLDFGNVSVGSSPTRALTISNRGNAALQITAVATAPPYSVTIPPTSAIAAGTSVAPGASVTATVTFSPAAAGQFPRSLTISNNDPARSPLTVALTGVGIAPSSVANLLQIDDGTYERVIGVPGADAYFVNRLTPPRYPATLRAVQIFFHDESSGLIGGDGITIVSGANPSGSDNLGGSRIQFRTTAARVTTPGRFIEFPVPPLTIASGDFVTGFTVNNEAHIRPMANDTSSPYRSRSYLGINGTDFRLVDTYANVVRGNFLIRAVID